MAWSTRQVAELAGTSLRAVRHYHEVGLLEEPERRANGYKSYGVAHLVRILRIKRLADLGFTLTQIAEMGDADEHPEEALRALDADLAETIERLQRVRLELSQAMRTSVPTDLPAEFGQAAAAADLTEADRSFIVVMTRLLDPEALDAYKELIEDSASSPADTEFDELPADADEETRESLAQRMYPSVRDLMAEHPEFGDKEKMAPRGVRFTEENMAVAMADLYNSAQRDVMRRVGVLLRGGARPGGDAGS